MFCYELHGFTGLGSFRIKQYRVWTLRASPVTHAFSTPGTTRATCVLDLAIDLAIRMMQIWQLHYLHLLRRQFWHLGRASWVCGSWQCDVRYLHHPSGEQMFIWTVTWESRIFATFQMSFNHLHIFNVQLNEDMYLNQERNSLKVFWQFNRNVSIPLANFPSTYTHSRWKFVECNCRLLAILFRDVFAPQSCLLRPLHHQNSRQILKEDLAYELRHPMSPRPAKVPVDDDHGHEDTDGVHDESEE